jgi:hypothetical protein
MYHVNERFYDMHTSLYTAADFVLSPVRERVDGGSHNQRLAIRTHAVIQRLRSVTMTRSCQLVGGQLNVQTR